MVTGQPARRPKWLLNHWLGSHGILCIAIWVFRIQIQLLITQRSTCLHFQRATLSKPNAPVWEDKFNQFNEKEELMLGSCELRAVSCELRAWKRDIRSYRVKWKVWLKKQVEYPGIATIGSGLTTSLPVTNPSPWYTHIFPPNSRFRMLSAGRHESYLHTGNHVWSSIFYQGYHLQKSTSGLHSQVWGRSW